MKKNFVDNGMTKDKTGSNLLVPIIILDFPNIFLQLRAEVTVPELFIPSKKINFGEVICGQQKTIILLFSFDGNMIKNCVIFIV